MFISNWLTLLFTQTGTWFQAQILCRPLPRNWPLSERHLGQCIRTCLKIMNYPDVIIHNPVAPTLDSPIYVSCLELVSSVRCLQGRGDKQDEYCNYWLWFEQVFDVPEAQEAMTRDCQYLIYQRIIRTSWSILLEISRHWKTIQGHIYFRFNISGMSKYGH